MVLKFNVLDNVGLWSMANGMEHWPKKQKNTQKKTNVVAFYQHTVLLFGLSWVHGSCPSFLYWNSYSTSWKRLWGIAALPVKSVYSYRMKLDAKALKWMWGNDLNGWKRHKSTPMKHRNGWGWIILGVNRMSLILDVRAALRLEEDELTNDVFGVCVVHICLLCCK